MKLFSILIKNYGKGSQLRKSERRKANERQNFCKPSLL
jgi:hypothetical protein